MKKIKIDVIAVAVTEKENLHVTHNRIVLTAAEIGVAVEIIDRSKKVRSKVELYSFNCGRHQLLLLD